MWPSVPTLLLTVIVFSAMNNAEMPEEDFRIISRHDLLGADSDIFRDNSSRAFSQLLFDVARDQVVVGARDTIYRLSLRGLRQLERADWPAPQDLSQLCQVKGQTEEDCHNFVRVLLAHGHRLFACGTNAFSPVCTWREIESINQVLESVSGVAHCPHSPRSNVTALLASSGELYAGTPTDFTGTFTAIYRSRGASPADLGTLRTSQFDTNWLNEPQFVGSFEDDRFVYFVFKEDAVEFMSCGKVVYSRIARVCKNDAGGATMMRDNWSTFLKARLNCSVPGDYPFYYDEVQGVEYLPHEQVLVATFTTPDNSIAGSAVCMYSMEDISSAFDGQYRPREGWRAEPATPQARDHFRCLTGTRAHQSPDYRPYHLMADAVQPISGRPVYTAAARRLTHVTADVTRTKHAARQYVLFAATVHGEVLKLAVLKDFSGACLVETWRLNDASGRFDVKSMQFVKDTTSVYLGTEQGVVRLPAHRCARYASRPLCLSAGDPYCGWDAATGACVAVASNAHEPYVSQGDGSCFVNDKPVDGGWGAWSAWEACAQDGEPEPDSAPDTCQCRRRACDNPRPARGGRPCDGMSTAVRACRVHGGWTPWSAWSACSATCGIALKTRARSCAAPRPAHGGRACVGLAEQQMYCTNLPPCPDPSLAPVDGGWSAWSAWSACAAAAAGCGPAAGRRERRRSCTDPAPGYGGADCDGEKVEYQTCDLRPCEVRKASAWTPWVAVPGNTSEGGYTEKRFKFLCRAPASSDQIKLTLTKEEDRYCGAAGACQSPAQAPAQAPAAAERGWGPCSVPCGGGLQRRRCDGCRGGDAVRACNTRPCEEATDQHTDWACWSDWSPCQAGAGCGPGRRERRRTCRRAGGCGDGDGGDVETRPCYVPCDDEEASWSAWSAWSACAGGRRARRRGCERGACAGVDVQIAGCGDDDEPLVTYSEDVETASFVRLEAGGALGVGSVVACVVAAFCMGCLTTLAAVTYLTRRRGQRLPWRRGPKVPSSPHYITAKQNSYVTVPLKDVPRKAKRQPSFTGISGASGVLLSKSNNISANNHNTGTLTTPKLYPKAIANEYDSMGTLRRHSNLPNNRNVDYEEDKFY